MRKTLKKAMSVVLSAALVLSLGNVGFSKEASAADGTYSAELSYTDSDWGNGDWGESDSAKTQVVLSEGSASYSVSTNAEEAGEGALVFVVDIEGFNDAAIEAGYAIELTDLAITCGDEALDVDLSKVATGDIEENGNYRIEIYNVYGPTVDDSPIDLAKLVCPNTITVDFTLNITAAAAAEEVVYFQWDGTWVPSYWTADDGDVTGSAEGGVTTGTVDADFEEGMYGVGISGMDLSTLANPMLTITYTGDVNLTDGTGDFSVQDADYKKLDLSGATDANGVFTMALDASLTGLYIYPSTAGITVTQIKISDAPASTEASNVFEAYLGYIGNGWGTSGFRGEDHAGLTWNVADVTLAEGEATYTAGATFDASQDSTDCVVIDIVGMQAAADAAGLAINLVSAGVTADGIDVPVDMDKVYTGELESNTGNYRIEFYNIYGDTANDPAVDITAFVGCTDIEVTFTLDIAEGVESDDEEAEEDETVALNEYHAYLGFQTAVWNYRNQWACKESMEASVDGYDFDTMAVFGSAATDPSQVVIENATITENGEYTVSMTGLDLSEDQSFNMLFVSTDIPSTMSGVEVTDAVITLDDTTYEMAVLPVKNDITNGKTDGDYAGYMFMAIDTWGTYADGDMDVLTRDADGVPSYTMPQNTISISFKISGVDFAFSDNAGAKKTVNGVTYKVTKNGNAKVVKVKDQKKVTIKNKVKINGTSYKVTSLKKGVFSGKSKVANVTLGKNIKKIPAKAFNKCTNLKKLTVNAKLTSVSKNAFKGCKKTIKVSGKKVAANVKTLKASGYKKFTK